MNDIEKIRHVLGSVPELGPVMESLESNLLKRRRVMNHSHQNRLKKQSAVLDLAKQGAKRPQRMLKKDNYEFYGEFGMYQLGNELENSLTDYKTKNTSKSTVMFIEELYRQRPDWFKKGKPIPHESNKEKTGGCQEEESKPEVNTKETKRIFHHKKHENGMFLYSIEVGGEEIVSFFSDVPIMVRSFDGIMKIGV